MAPSSVPSPQHSRHSLALRVLGLAAVYAFAYVLAGWLDLLTTGMALARPGASEGNVYATEASGYVAARAWWITGLGFAFVGAFLLWAAAAAGQVAEAWLDRPVSSFGKFYVNPFARSVRDRAPLHMMSFVIAFVPLRLLAAGNNLLIWAYGTAPLGRLIGLLTHCVGSLAAFWLVMAPLFYLVAMACSPVAAQVLRWLRRV